VRPLPPRQLDYARLDTHYLFPLYEIQARELDEGDRWPQALHRFSRVLQSRWEPRGFDPEDFWRLSGVRDLDDEGRGVLRALYIFRDRHAQAENRPPFKVLTNRALLALSKERPEDMRSLQLVSGVSARLARKYGQSLLTTIDKGRKEPLAWDMRPRRNNARGGQASGHHTAACRIRFEALRAWRNKAAVARGVEPDLVLTNRILWAVACRNPQCRSDLTNDGLLARWQVDEFAGDLLKVVREAL
jgi:ribonuclease D